MQALEAGKPYASVIYRARHKNGHLLWAEGNARRLTDGSGYVVVIRDITRRREVEEQLAIANTRLRELASQDGLTGLFNRRHFDELLGREWRRARREDMSLAVALIDVDSFKLFNDCYGHLAGDDCLRRIAATIAGCMRRASDVAARYGGEEIAVILPGVDEQGALNMGEMMRGAVRALAIEHQDGPAGFVTISIGVAACQPSRGGDPVTALVGAADNALYRAKRSGRNRVMAGPADILGETLQT